MREAKMVPREPTYEMIIALNAASHGRIGFTSGAAAAAWRAMYDAAPEIAALKAVPPDAELDTLDAWLRKEWQERTRGHLPDNQPDVPHAESFLDAADAISSLRSERDALIHDNAQFVQRDTNRTQEIVAIEAERDALRKVLAELVACKDLKARIADISGDLQDLSLAQGDPESIREHRLDLHETRRRLQADYEQRKPRAWDAARAAIAAVPKGEGR